MDVKARLRGPPSRAKKTKTPNCPTCGQAIVAHGRKDKYVVDRQLFHETAVELDVGENATGDAQMATGMPLMRNTTSARLRNTVPR